MTKLVKINIILCKKGIIVWGDANYESRPGHGRLVTTDHASIITFLLCVLCILLLISGIEPNPGPGTDDSLSCPSFSSSFNDIVSAKYTLRYPHVNLV
jgi:hypothetical protein